MMVFAVCGSMMLVTLSWALIMIETAIVKSRVQSAMDAANLSLLEDVYNHYTSTTGSSLTQIKADAQNYFNANIKTGFWDSLIPTVTLSVTVTGTPTSGLTIQLSANATVNLISPINLTTTSSGSGTTTDAIGAVNFTATDTSTIVPSGLLELALVLDNTGSMSDVINGQTKMKGLQTAANTLIASVLSSTGTNMIGLVPFTNVVNVKGALPPSGSWMLPTYYGNDTTVVKTPTDQTTASWSGCVAEPRNSSLQMYPLPYSPLDSMKFTRYFYNVPPAGLVVNTRRGGYQSYCQQQVYSTTTYTSVPTSGSISLQGLANYCSGNTSPGEGVGTTLENSSSGQQFSISQNVGCISQPVTFLTNNQSTLTTAVNNMVANGPTVIPVGILWGWRMLSSSWSNALSNNNGWISTTSTYPLPETTNNLKRVMIVLTDGENDPGADYYLPNYFYFNGLSGVGRDTLPAPTVYRSDGSSLGSTSNPGTMGWTGYDQDGTPYSADVNTFQLAVCTAAKNAGITIYAITFGSVSSVGTATMKSCATPNDFYNAPDGTSLNTIFQQIAANLGILRLTQ